MSRPTDCSQHAALDWPEGYPERVTWAYEMQKTHDQIRCDECKRWLIWRPRP